MRIKTILAASALGLSALGLSACATGLNTKVTRYSAASIPSGTSFYVVPREGTATPQFYRYAQIAAAQLAAKGYQPAGTPALADVLVKLDYGVDQGRTEYVADPYSSRSYGPGAYGPFGWGSRFGRNGWSWSDPFYDRGWGVWYGRPYNSRWSSYPYYYGWDDPFWYGTAWGPRGYGPYGGYGADRYTVYKSYLDMDIVQRATNAPLFEGHAKARSQTDELDALVPNLIEAMFTGFPGQNGQTVKITVPNTPKR